MFCMMPSYHRFGCLPAYGYGHGFGYSPMYERTSCGANPMAGFGRLMALLTLLTFGPVIFAPLLLFLFSVIGFALKVAFFAFLVTGFTSLLDCASKPSCPMRSFMSNMCPCGPGGDEACPRGKDESVNKESNTREAKPKCCGEPKAAEPAQTRHRVELWGAADEYQLTVDVPGIRRVDLSVTAQPWSARSGDAPTLTIDGATKTAKVHRTVRLPRDANVDGATVSHADGQLSLRVPRAKKAAHSIAVQPAAAEPSTVPSTEPLPFGAPVPPVVREVTPNDANVQLPEEQTVDLDEPAEGRDSDWEPVAVDK